MTEPEMVDFSTLFFRDCLSMHRAKNADYAHDETDALANFNRLGESLGLPPAQVLITHASKHWDTLCRFARDGEVSSETLRGRCIDLANYAMLLAAMAEGNGKGNPEQEGDYS